MMMGSVNSRREAIIQFVVLGENHQRQAIKAVIDTVYNGKLLTITRICSAIADLVGCINEM